VLDGLDDDLGDLVDGLGAWHRSRISAPAGRVDAEPRHDDAGRHAHLGELGLEVHGTVAIHSSPGKRVTLSIRWSPRRAELTPPSPDTCRRWATR
jgi:hypothetical protein